MLKHLPRYHLLATSLPIYFPYGPRGANIAAAIFRLSAGPSAHQQSQLHLDGAFHINIDFGFLSILFLVGSFQLHHIFVVVGYCRQKVDTLKEQTVDSAQSRSAIQGSKTKLQ